MGRPALLCSLPAPAHRRQHASLRRCPRLFAEYGSVIRLVFPAPTEERRKELCKQVSKEGESSKVAIRNIRRDAVDKLKAQKKANELSEDDLKDAEKDVQELTDKYVKLIDKAVKEKEQEVMSL